MKQTEYGQLCQWDPEDRVLRSDFNADNAKIAAALAALDGRMEDAATKAALTALQTKLESADQIIRNSKLGLISTAGGRFIHAADESQAVLNAENLDISKYAIFSLDIYAGYASGVNFYLNVATPTGVQSAGCFSPLGSSNKGLAVLAPNVTTRVVFFPFQNVYSSICVLSFGPIPSIGFASTDYQYLKSLIITPESGLLHSTYDFTSTVRGIK